MSSTTENLKEAFAGESQANQKYRAFAKRAELDGFPNVAKLFRTAAEAERIHAEGHLRSLEGIGATKDNLQVAICILRCWSRQWRRVIGRRRCLASR